jgi:hypothetical protein
MNLEKGNQVKSFDLIGGVILTNAFDKLVNIFAQINFYLNKLSPLFLVNYAVIFGSFSC